MYRQARFRWCQNCRPLRCFRRYWYLEVSATVDTLQNSGLATLRGGVIGGNTGNDSIYLGDQLTEFGAAFVGGGAGNDLPGTFNSGASTAGKLNTNFSGATVAGEMQRQSSFNSLVIPLATKVAGNSGNDSVIFLQLLQKSKLV